MSITVAYLGLGIMGGAMAANLASKGYSVFAWNRTAGRPGAKVAESAGATISNSAAEAVQNADVVFLCLSDVSDIEQMLLGANSVTKSAKKGHPLYRHEHNRTRMCKAAFARASQRRHAFS